MHYRAEEKVTRDRKSIIPLIPAFLLLDTDQFDHEEINRFLDIMEIELQKGNSFDNLFFEDYRYYLTDWISPYFGHDAETVDIYKECLAKLDRLEPQNIINTHKNKNLIKIVLPHNVSGNLLEVLKEHYNLDASNCLISLELADIGR